MTFPNCEYTRLAPIAEQHQQDEQQQPQSGHDKCCCCGCRHCCESWCWCCPSSRRCFVALIALGICSTLFALLLLKFVWLGGSKQPEVQAFRQYNQMKWQLHTTHGLPSAICLNTSSSPFQRAMVLQQHGIIELKLDNGSLDAQGTWTLIPRHFNEIWHDLLRRVDLLKLRSDDAEHKYFIAFSPKAPRPRRCNIVTLGVGHTVDAERELIRTYPECRLVAADPSAELNANLVQDIGGTFVHAAVGGKTGRRKSVIWGEDVGMQWGQVELKVVPQIGIRDFLHNYTNGAPIDLMFIDVEGAEFGILEQFVDHYDEFPAPICQLNMEVHTPGQEFANYTHQRFFRLFNRWMRSGPFALMHTELYTEAYPDLLFLRLFLVNMRDPICARKFFC